MKPKPSAVPHSLRLVQLGASLGVCSARGSPMPPGDLRHVGVGCPLPVTQVSFLRSELCGRTRIFGFDVNFGGAVADNLQEAGLDDLAVPSSLTPHTTGRHPTKSLSQACRGLVHLLLITEMAVLIKYTSFGV